MKLSLCECHKTLLMIKVNTDSGNGLLPKGTRANVDHDLSPFSVTRP